jgi:hypothetical protein
MDSKPSENTLYYGDDLDILRRYIPDEIVVYEESLKETWGA